MKLVRKAGVQDAEAIAQVHVHSWQHAYRGIIPDDFLDALSVRERTEFWRSQLATETRETLVIEAEREVVGFAGFGPSRDDNAAPTTAELYAIYIAPEHWGGGCGSLLWAEVEKILRAAGIAQVTLWVLSENQRGRRFYELLGFNADGTFKGISLSGTALTEMRYVKNFQAISS